MDTMKRFAISLILKKIECNNITTIHTLNLYLCVTKEECLGLDVISALNDNPGFSVSSQIIIEIP